MESRHKIVKVILRGLGLYFLYNIYQIGKKEMIVEQARVIKEQQTRFGGDFELSEEKKKILQQAEEYLDSHAGYKYLSRMRTQEFFEQRFTKTIQEKQEALAQADPEDKEKIEKLKSHLDQLNRAYKSMMPKMPTSWDDLRDKEEDEQN